MGLGQIGSRWVGRGWILEVFSMWGGQDFLMSWIEAGDRVRMTFCFSFCLRNRKDGGVITGDEKAPGGTSFQKFQVGL